MFKPTWDRFVLFLPLMIMACLALATYWLVHSSPTVGTLAVQKPLTHDPDYFMSGLSLRTFDTDGRVRTEVLGDKARHYPDTQWLEIDAIHIKSFDDQGRLTTATANRGLTNEDTSEVQLLGNAIVVREANAPNGGPPSPRMEYRGEFLHAFMTTERVISHKPVVLIRGNDKFTADTLDYDNVEQVVQMRGHVRGTLTPNPR
jgi:lipopolysaccharide export system protein LptC